MPAFKPPLDVKRKSKEWIRVAKPGFRHPKKLWGDYCQRFSTITIPILDQDAYFADAIMAAGRAENREHLEELLAERSKQRREDLEGVVFDIALAAIRLRHPFPSDAARNSALKVGQTGSLDSLLQFVCGFTFGWPESDEEDERAQIKHDGPVDAGGGIRSDRELATSDIDSEQFYYENGMPSSGAWEEWETDEDDAWNDTSWKVRECSDSDGEPVERKPVPASPITGKDTSSIEAERETDRRTQPSDMEDLQTVPGQAVGSDGRVPCASRDSPLPTHRALALSPRTRDRLAGRVPSLASDSAPPTENTEQLQHSQPRMPRQLPEPSDVKVPDKPWSSVPGPPTERDGEPGGYGRSASPTGPALGRKGALRVGSGDERNDTGRDRRKRRATDRGG